MGYTTLKGTETGEPARWAVPAIGLELDKERSPFQWDTLTAEVMSGYGIWSALPCQAPDLFIQQEAPENGYGVDGVNRLLWIDIGWPGTPGELALTLVTRDKVSGEIVDADMLMNQQHFSFTQDSDLPLPWVQVRGVLGHEFGHFLGLDHSDAINALMTATVAGDEALPTGVMSDDAAGLCSLYGKTTFPVDDTAEGNGLFPMELPGNFPFQESLIVLWLAALLGFSFSQRRHGLLWLPLMVGMACVTAESPTTPSGDAGATDSSESTDGGLQDILEEGTETPDVEALGDSDAYGMWTTIPPSELAGSTFLTDKLTYYQPLLESKITVSMLGLGGITLKEDGSFERFGPGQDGETLCQERGTWTSRNNALVLLTDAFVPTCFSDVLPQEDEFEVSRSELGTIRLSRLGGNWLFGSSLLPLDYSVEMTEGPTPIACDDPLQTDCSMSCTEDRFFEVECQGVSWVGSCEGSGNSVTCTGPCGVVSCKDDDWKACAEDNVGMVCEP
jgi:hypothetical protein